MGIPLPTSAAPASGAPPAGDQANTVAAGVLSILGQCSAPFCFYGRFNLSLWSPITTTLTTQSGTANATVAIGAGIAAGENIYSPAGIVPPGTTIGSTSTVNVGGITTIQLAGLTTAQVSGLTATNDPAAVFTGNGSEATGTVVVERSFDGGATWLALSEDQTGIPASYQFGSGHLTYPVSLSFAEYEKGVAYRIHATALSAGTISYRFSATGGGASSWTPQ